MRYIYIIYLIAAACLLAACSEGQRLAVASEGTWQSSVMHIADDNADTGVQSYEFAPRFTFVKNVDDNGGPLTIDTDITIHTGTGTYTAHLTANGSWTAYDDDEILFLIDSKGTSITPVDTSYPLTSAIQSAIALKFKTLAGIDDIKIKDGVMRAEISSSDVVMIKE